MGEAPEAFTSFDVNLKLVALVAWLVVLLLYGIFSMIFVYHWRQYAIGSEMIQRTLRIYFITTGILFTVAAATIIFI